MKQAPRVLVVGTKNLKKCREMQDLLHALPFDVRPLSDYPDVDTVEETGDTFNANAAAKAIGYARATGQWCVADDSGIEIAALGGRPGVYSARWGGEDGNDELNNQQMLNELRDVPPEQRQAQYVCVVVLADPEGLLLEASATCPGMIIDTPRGSGGFGYDPYFFLPDRNCTMAELPAADKHAISHRGQALRLLRAKMQQLLKS